MFILEVNRKHDFDCAFGKTIIAKNNALGVLAELTSFYDFIIEISRATAPLVAAILV